MKKCRYCHEIKPPPEFQGYRGEICFDCKRKRLLSYMDKWRTEHPDYAKEYYKAGKSGQSTTPKRIPRIIDGLRRCSRCKQYKPLQDFGSEKHHRPDNLSPYCKPCKREIAKETRKRLKLENPDLQKARDKRRSERIPPEERRARAYEWREHNIETHRGSIRAWKKKNPDKVREQKRRRENHKRNVSGFHTEEEWQAVLSANGHRCLLCGTDNDLTRDHIVPLVMGGSDYPDNLQPLCRKCNSAKGDTIADYREKII